MKIVIQRCKKASVTAGNDYFHQISHGLVLLVGFTAGDNEETINYMVDKILNLRIFDDENGVMNYSILEQGGEILSISQFTLYADATKGRRPSYKKSLNSHEAQKLYYQFNDKLAERVITKTGIFGADMDIEIVNNGPVTIILEKEI